MIQNNDITLFLKDEFYKIKEQGAFGVEFIIEPEYNTKITIYDENKFISYFKNKI